MFTREEIEAQIRASFKSLLFSPRGNQVDIIYRVLDAFLNKNKSNVVLSAPTGIGKSVIGAVTSHALDAFTPEDTNNASVIAMGTNHLAHQYFDAFSKLDSRDVHQIKGAVNYNCAYMESQPSSLTHTGEDCVNKHILPIEADKYCNSCTYKQHKSLVDVSSILITNYSYYLVSKLASGHLKPRKLTVFDEAHILNDVFCSFAEIVVSSDLLSKYIKELSTTNGKCDDEAAGLVMFKQRLEAKEIHEGSFKEFLNLLNQLYSSAAKTLASQSRQLKTVDIVQCNKYDKLSRKYKRLSESISDMMVSSAEHVFDGTVPNTISVKPVFMGKMITGILSKYNLFMSATITEQFVEDTLNLDMTVTEFVDVEPVFPKENKPILFLGKTALNYNSMKDPAVLDELKNHVKCIAQFHPKEKGLIIVPSFFLGSQLSRSVPRTTKVFEHKSGDRLPELIRDFKNHRGPAVFISPSIFEGVDFEGDYARFQIIVKAPFASLGDQRIKYIADNYSNIYREMTLIKIIQGAGRGVRSPTDTCVTYCCDLAIERLYNSSMNIWKNQFDVKGLS